MLRQQLVAENTSRELKFALTVEEELNKLVYPEYRQLVVEALVLFFMFLEQDVHYVVNHVVKLDCVVVEANRLFLMQQRELNGDAVLCCGGMGDPNYEGDSMGVTGCGAPNGVCRFFYDSAPSGTYGTMTYLMQAILGVLYSHLRDSDNIVRLEPEMDS